MTPIRRLLETVHLTFAGLWLGSLVMTGVAAAVIFPAVRELDPQLPAFSEYTGPHWRLAAGTVAAKIFLISDAIQLGCIIICGLTLGAVVITAEGWRRPIATSIRLIALFGAVGLMTYSFSFLGPRMNTNMTSYWDAARAGDNEAAEQFQAAFDKDHPTATKLMIGSFLCALLVTSSGALAAAGAPGAPFTPENTPTKSRLQQPELAKRRRVS